MGLCLVMGKAIPALKSLEGYEASATNKPAP